MGKTRSISMKSMLINSGAFGSLENANTFGTPPPLSDTWTRWRFHKRLYALWTDVPLDLGTGHPRITAAQLPGVLALHDKLHFDRKDTLPAWVSWERPDYRWPLAWSMVSGTGASWLLDCYRLYFEMGDVYLTLPPSSFGKIADLEWALPLIEHQLSLQDCSGRLEQSPGMFAALCDRENPRPQEVHGVSAILHWNEYMLSLLANIDMLFRNQYSEHPGHDQVLHRVTAAQRQALVAGFKNFFDPTHRPLFDLRACSAHGSVLDLLVKEAQKIKRERRGGQ